MNSTSPRQPDPDTAVDFQPESIESDDDTIEADLREAYVAPPIPRSLLKRLDRAISHEWGIDSKLAETSTVRTADRFLRGVRWVRSLPIAAAAAVLILLSVFLRPSTTAYGWTNLLESLAGQQLVQLESDSDELRQWLSVSDGLLKQQLGEQTEITNLQQQASFFCSPEAQQVQRSQLTAGKLDRQALVLSALAGTGGQAAQRFADARVLREECRSDTSSDDSAWLLSVKLQCVDRSKVQVRAKIDRKTRLPLTVEFADRDVPARRLTLAYLNDPLTAASVFALPTDLPVVERSEVRTAAVALNDVSEAAAEDNRLRTNESSASTVVHVEKTVSSPRQGSPTNVAAITEPAPSQDLSALQANADARESRLAAKAADVYSSDTLNWPPVRSQQLDERSALRKLNKQLNDLWQKNDVEPVAAADDEELLRRVYLDLAGRIPSVPEVRQYLSSDNSNRFELLVDELLRSPDHSSHLAAMYRRFLIPEGIDLTDFGGVEAFDQWLSDEFDNHRSYDGIVRDLLLAEGRLTKSGPLLLYSATRLDPDQLAARTSRVFLGIRLECAQCHDHPFEPWTQRDFWGYAAFFARISRPQAELENVSTVMRVRDVDRGEVMLPDTEQIVAPRLLHAGQEPQSAVEDHRRRLLTDWVVGRDNPYFARAAVNRIWSMMFGRGLVDPVDDFGIANPPVAPEVMELLAGYLVDSEYDLRSVFRLIALSDAYRLSSAAEEEDEMRDQLFARMNVKTLSAEQVFDCITVATMPSSNGTRGFQLDRFNNAARDQFLELFRTPVGRATEYQGGIPQALTLMNGSLTAGATGLSESGLLKSLEAPFFTNKQRVEILFFATLSRRPIEAELDLLGELLNDEASGDSRQTALSDLLWVLLNSAEFTLNH